MKTILSSTTSQMNIDKSLDLPRFLDTNLNHSDHRIFRALLIKWELYGTVYPSQYTLADEAGVSRGTVQRRQPKLIKLGLFSLTQDKWDQSYNYYLHPTFLRPSVMAQLKRYYLGFMTICMLVSPILKGGESIRGVEINTIQNPALVLEPGASALVNLPQSESYKDALNGWHVEDRGPSMDVLEEKEAFEILEGIFATPRKQNAMEEWSPEQLAIISGYPGRAVEYARYRLEVLSSSGKVATGQFSYLMAIIKSYDPKRDKIPSTGMMKGYNNQGGINMPYQRPTAGPMAIYKPKKERVIETDFEFAANVERILHQRMMDGTLHKNAGLDTNPRLKLLTPEEIARVMSVHKGCQCRPSGDEMYSSMIQKAYGINPSDVTPNIKEGTSWSQVILAGEPELGYDHGSVETVEFDDQNFF